MDTSESEATNTLLQEYATLEYILLGDLRDLLEEAADATTRKWLAAVLDALLDTLPRQFDLKARDGYLDFVIEAFPTWSAEVVRLRQEHIELFSKLQMLRDCIDQRARFEDIADDVRDGLKEWMRSLVAYHRHENRIVQTALNLEVGVGD